MGIGPELERRYLDAIAPETQFHQGRQITIMAFLKDLYRQDVEDSLLMIEKNGLRSMTPLDHALVIAAIDDTL